LSALKQNVILGCAAWKDRVNMEDVLFAGAVITSIGKNFSINCDSSHIAEAMYEKAKKDMFGFMKKNDASHYHRLMGFGLEKDIRYCLTPDLANVLPQYEEGKLIVK
jgi:2-phosphosulfolactate phosphatase